MVEKETEREGKDGMEMLIGESACGIDARWYDVRHRQRECTLLIYIRW